ncbi:nudix hydrolase homolog 13 [Actinidia rufa]|uniref:Nudix hydrolase homolog 13 n=1 Tax=Actinidia rufa TaxID=165716 RepID=A0A7J0GZP3_9ERIC|nr:nudix hydrolase homolog 13 [Actinidia rufa]
MVMASVVARTGRNRQRYDNNNIRLVSGCIPYRVAKHDDHHGDSEHRIEVLMISSPNRDDLVFPKGGWDDDETCEEAACRESLEEAGVKGILKIAHTSMRTTTFPFVFQPSAWLDVSAVPSLDRLWLSACRYAPIVVSVSRLLTPPYSYGVAVSNMVIVPSSLIRGTSDVTKALARMVPLFATASSSGAEDLRACRSRQLGGDHCPSTAGVPLNVNRAPAQGRPSLLTSDTLSEGNGKPLGVWEFRSKSSQKICSLKGGCKGYMFALEVTEELEVWPEQGNRDRKWLCIKEAFRLCRYEWMCRALDKFLAVMTEDRKHKTWEEVVVEPHPVPVSECQILSTNCYVKRSSGSQQHSRTINISSTGLGASSCWDYAPSWHIAMTDSSQGCSG